MATENSSSRSSSAADSYVGSLISLISKSEIRYEGILYNINTEESSIGLQNVRSFGTEGRKKDGPQVPPSDNVYEYILFRGSDIKDLQVKSSPPPQPTVPIHNDPAIIQSHYPSPSSAPSTTLSSSVSRPSPDIGTQGAQGPLPTSNFQGSYPLYQPGGTMSWGASPPINANGSGLNMPMYWQGYYGAPNGLLQQSLLQPPPMPSMPSIQQPMHYPVNANMSAGVEAPSTSVPATSSSISMNTSFLTPMPSVPLAAVPSETTSSSLPDKAPTIALPAANASSRAPPTSRTIGPLISSKPSVPGGATLPYQTAAQSASGTSDSVRTQASSPAPTLPLVTPAQLLPSGSTTVPVSQSPQTDHKDVEVIKVSSPPPPLNASSPPVAREVQPPILPLPPPARTNYKPNGGPTFHNHHGYRGRERGRGGSGPSSRVVTKFTEDFDFTAMNEKFNKDEVWGSLGKNIKDSEGSPNIVNDDADDYGYEEETDVPKVESKTVYNKDDFFDSLSCDALNRTPHNGRTRFSEQVKIDTETFGDISRQWGGRGPGRGGWGRGGGRYYGRGNGYGGRGRGRGQGQGTYYNRTS